MEIEIENDDLVELLITENRAKPKWPISVVSSFKKKLVFLQEAPDEKTIRNWKSLHFEKLKGDRDGQFSIRLNDQFRLIFKFNDLFNPPKLTILNIEDYH